MPTGSRSGDISNGDGAATQTFCRYLQRTAGSVAEVSRSEGRRTLTTLHHVDRSSLTVMTGLRCSLGVLVPLVAGAVSGHTGDGVSAAVGALLVGFVSFEGRYRTTLRAMTVATVTITLSVFVGAAIGADLVALAVVLAVWGLAAGLAGAWGTGVSVAALQAVVALVVFSALPMTVGDAAVQGGWVLAGSLVQVVLALATWPWRGVGSERHAVSAVYRRLAAYAEEAPSAPPAADQLVVGTEALADPNPFGDHETLVVLQRLLQIADDLRTVLSATILATTTQWGGAGGGTPGSATAANGHWPALGDVSAALVAVADALDWAGPGHRPGADATPDRRTSPGPEGPGPDPRPIPNQSILEDLLCRARELVAALPGQPRRTGAAPLADLLRRARTDRRRGPVTAPTSHRIWRPEHRWGRPGEAGRWIGRAVADPELVRHAVRLAGVLVLGMVLARLLHLSDGYWVPMTAAVVVRADFTGTIQRGAGRVVGTLVGSSLVTVVAALVRPDHAAEIAAVMVLAWGMYSAFRANYGLYSMLLTATVVVLLTLVGEPIVATARDRAVATAIGGVLAMAVFVAWPTFKHRLLPGSLAQMVASQGAYAAAVVEATAGDERGDLSLLAVQARLWRTRVGVLLQQLPIEPGSSDTVVSAATAVVAQANRCAHLALAAHSAVAHPASADGVEPLQAGWLQAVAAAIRRISRHQAVALDARSGKLGWVDGSGLGGTVSGSADGGGPLEVDPRGVPGVVADLLEAFVELQPAVDRFSEVRR